MKKQVSYQVFFYVAGLLIQALGLTLNTKAGLGVSPLISIAYSASEIFMLPFANATLVLYCVFAGIEILLHCAQTRRHPTGNLRHILLMDVLQIPLSLVFTRFLGLFGLFIPDVAAGTTQWTERLPLRLAVLLLAILCTGVGAAMSLSMRLVPNPGDGVVQAIADFLHIPVGLTKNGFDFVNIALTAALGLLLADRLVGIGIGTVLAVLGVGRVIALFHHVAGQSVRNLSGMAC